MRVSKTLRRLAVVTATASLLGTVPFVAPASADTGTVSANPAGAADTGKVTIVLTTQHTFTPAMAAEVTVSRTADETDTIPATVLSGAGTTLNVEFDATNANPGAYDIKVSETGTPEEIGELPPYEDECTGCFQIFKSPPVVSSVSPNTVGGNGARILTINGTNFTTKAGWDYCSPPADCSGKPTLTVTPSTGIGILTTNFNGDALAATTSTTITRRFTVASGAATGPRDITVTNTDGDTDTCEGCFVVGPTVTLTGASPSTLATGVTGKTVVLTGTNFDPAAQVVIRQEDDDDSTVDYTSKTWNSPTQITLNGVSTGADAPAAIEIFVRNPDQSYFETSSIFSTTAPPTITSVVETNGASNAYGQGAVSRIVTITGTGFQTGAQVAIGTPTGITMNSTTVNSGAEIVVNVTLAETGTGAPSIGQHTVTVTNPDFGTATADGSNAANGLGVAVGPKVNSLSPPSRGRGETFELTITGTGFENGSGATGVDVTITDVTVDPSSVVVTGTNTITLEATASNDLNAAGSKTVTVVNKGNKGKYTCVGCFSLDNLQTNSISPSTVFNDSTQAFTVAGSGFASDAVVTLIKDGTGSGTVPDITGTGTAVNVAGTSLTTNFALNGAAPGLYLIRVTNPTTNAGTGTCTCKLTVVAAAPSITAVSPDDRGEGALNETITITGTSFLPGATVTFDNTGVTLVGAPTITPTQITAVVNIAAGSAPPTPPIMAPQVHVTNTDGQTDSADFTVNEGPVPASASPASRSQDTATTVTLTGTDFSAGSTITVSGTGVTAGSPTFTNGTLPSEDTLAALFTVSSGAETGIRTVTVRAADGGRGSCACLTITQKPTITSVTPAKGARSATTSVVIEGTNLTGATAVAGTGITATRTADGATSVTFDFAVAADAPLTTRDVTITNGDGGTATKVAAFKVITKPNAPTNVSATRGNQQATVTWTASTDSGNDPLTGYTVTASPGGATATVGPEATQAVVTGLTNGTAYTFTVHATNAAGNSPESAASAPVTPATTPGAPTSPSATAGEGQATVSWTAPSSNGGSTITGYTVTASPGGATKTVDGSTLTTAFTGLTNGTAYTFTVHATNSVGDSPESVATNSVTPFTVPDAPTGVSGTPGEGAVTVSWTAPAFDGGSAITGYTVTAAPGGATASTNGSTFSAVVNGLTNGTAYTFTVTATNARGTSAASSPSASVTPFTTPGAPTAVSGTPADSSVHVSWTAPASNGGDAITGYTVTASPGGATKSVDGTLTTATVTGLTNGTAYTFTVVAQNNRGAGPASAASDPVTPYTVPGAPTDVIANPDNGKATVTWAAPASNGGNAITGYVVTASPGGSTKNVDASTLSTEMTGLTNGTAYTFTVGATNAAGTTTSAPSAAVTPRTIPGAPTGVTATRGNTSASVTWTAPASNGGSAITGYTVTASPGGATATVDGDTLTAVVTGLTNGTSYTFTVVATNVAGDGPASAASNAVTPATVAGAPTGVTATAGEGNATVSWTAPATDGSSAITGYTVTSSPGGLTASTNAATLTAVVNGLTNGTSYTFTVVATNAVGDSAASTPSNAVTPFTEPDAPTGVTATRGNTSASVSWTAPFNGGSPITGYTVTAAPGGATANVDGSTLTANVTGLTNGTAYTFTVVATNARGASPASAASNAVTPATVPSAPTNVVATRGHGAATINWTASAANGSPVTSYTVTSTPGGFTSVVTGTSATIGGLTNGTSYTFSVFATNAVGNSTSAVSNAVVPTAVTALSLTATTQVVSGGVTTVKGTLVKTGGTRVAGQPVRIYAMVSPSRTWAHVRTLTTAADGTFTTNFTLTRTTKFVAVYLGATGLDPARSAERTTKVAYKVAANYALSGRTLTAYGSISPNAAGRLVYLRYRRSDGAIFTLNYAKVATNGTYRISKGMPPGIYNVFVYIPAGANNVAGQSAFRSITIR